MFSFRVLFSSKLAPPTWEKHSTTSGIAFFPSHLHNRRKCFLPEHFLYHCYLVYCYIKSTQKYLTSFDYFHTCTRHFCFRHRASSLLSKTQWLWTNYNVDASSQAGPVKKPWKPLFDLVIGFIWSYYTAAFYYI